MNIYLWREAYLSLWRHTRKGNSCLFCMAVFACFIVVMFSGVTLSFVDNTSLVFMKQAESSVGKSDLRLSAFVDQTKITDAQKDAPFDFDVAARGGVSVYVTAHGECYEEMTNIGVSEKSAYYDTFSNTYGIKAFWTQNGGPCVTGSTVKAANSKLSHFNSKSIAENRMDGDWNFEPTKKGEVLIPKSLADRLNVGKGDKISVIINWSVTALKPADGWEVPSGYNNWEGRIKEDETHVYRDSHVDWMILGNVLHDDANVFMVIKDVYKPSDFEPKLTGVISGALLMEEEHFWDIYRENTHPEMWSERPGENPQWVPPETVVPNPASQYDMLLPESERLEIYAMGSVSQMIEKMNGLWEKFAYKIGFAQVTIDMKMLKELEILEWMALYLNLAIDIIMFILFVLCTMLVYNLLSIMLHGRAYEFAVRRMIGSNFSHLGVMMLMQILFIAVPAWVIGLGIAQLLMKWVTDSMSDSLEVDLGSGMLSGSAILVATGLGLLIPTIGGIKPMIAAAGANIVNTLNKARPKISLTKVSISRTQSFKPSPTPIAVGLGLFTFGFAVYYLIPLALLTSNLSLFFNIFLGVLAGLIVGLVVLSLNLEHSLSQLALRTLFFWEQKSVYQLCKKNLVAHRVRNRKAVIMYALSLGFIVFVYVFAMTNIESIKIQEERSTGVDLRIRFNDDTYLTDGEVYGADLFVKNHPEYFDSHAYTYRYVMSNGLDSNRYPSYMNVGRYFDRGNKIWGVSPFVDDVIYSEYMDVDKRRESVKGYNDPFVALYDRHAADSIVLPSYDQKLIHLEVGDKALHVEDVLNDKKTSEEWAEIPDVLQRYKYKEFIVPSAFLNAAPYFSGMTEFIPRAATSDRTMRTFKGKAIVSLPSIARLLGHNSARFTGLRDMPIDEMILKWKDGLTDSDKDNAIRDIKQEMWNQSKVIPAVEDIRDDTSDLESTESTLTFVFSVLAFVGLFLCFFGLLATIITTVRDSEREFAVLKAIGFSKFRLYRLVSHEAFIVVLVGSLLGVNIGTIVGLTFSQQQTLFTQLPVVFFFPFNIAIMVISTALVGAWLASFFALLHATHQPISSALKL
eukprot:TRINITY_DN85_c0_g1_i1.p1 TRINITY_DN85_c0_g1~~TRINITY_DN85_c0_g1_i1.p1  ORF type:complete len:1078 (-),score=239.60 TRINITY_DN85_c0_g1_i1:358-3591(-)